MLYDALSQRLRKIDLTLEGRRSLLDTLRRWREETAALRQQGLSLYESSALQKDIDEYHGFALTYGKLARRGMLDYPVRIEKSESPDFIITENGRRYGLEATKATPEAFQKWLSRSPVDDESFLLHRLPVAAPGRGSASERQAARLIQAAILRKAALLPLYRRNSGSDSQQLVVRILSRDASEAETLLKVLWREGLIECALGFERVLIAANSRDFILLDPTTGGVRRL